MDCGSHHAQAMEVEGDHIENEDALKPSKRALEFQEMIKTRKVEVRTVTEDKRRETVGRLEERKLRTEAESEMKICGLPNEMWKEVLSHVDTPQDVGSLWEAYPKFRDLSGESQALECLFSKLLSIESLPHLWKRDWDKSVCFKNFRAVSKGMRNAVDRCLEDDFMKSLCGNNEKLCPGMDIWINKMDVVNIVLARARDGSPEERAKRVFGRSLSLIVCNYFKLDHENGHDRFLELRSKMISLLEIVGDQIWYFFFNPDPIPNIGECIDCLMKRRCRRVVHVSITEMYLFFRDLVALMPNLKWLKFSFNTSACTRQGLRSISMKTFRIHPFPHLRQLQRVGIGNVGQRPQQLEIATAVVRSNSHVKTLDLHLFLDGTETDEMKSLLSPLSDLKAVNRWIVPSFIYTIAPLQPLLSSSNCKLRIIKLLCLGKELSLQSVFRFFNHFPTLEEITMFAGGRSVRNEIVPLVLPNLAYLNIHIDLEDGVNVIDASTSKFYVFLYSLQFLIHSKKLKTLIWSANPNPPKRKLIWKLYRVLINHESHEEMINFRGGFRDLTYSNIWDIFPKLESAKTIIYWESQITTRVFCRP